MSQSECQKRWYERHRESHIANVGKRNKIIIEENKALIRSLKTKCSRCDESDPDCLDFHHLDSTLKEFDVSRMRSHGRARLLSEIEKCIVLCANCHRKLHASVA